MTITYSSASELSKNLASPCDPGNVCPYCHFTLVMCGVCFQQCLKCINCHQHWGPA